VQYLERVALLGLYDLLLHRGGRDASASASTTLDLPDRAGALRAWEKAWNAFTGGHDGDARVFWQERAPDMCIALPPSPSVLSSSAQVRHIVATIIDPDPPVGPEQGEDEQHDVNDLFSFGPWFITATRHGINVRTSYSYLDLYGYLGGAGGVGGGERAPGGIQSGEENRDGDRDRNWTVIKVPVRNVLAFALSTELDLVVVISCVSILTRLLVSHFGSYCGTKKGQPTDLTLTKVRSGVWSYDHYASGMVRLTRAPKCRRYGSS
jgi:hypothetical protein